MWKGAGEACPKTELERGSGWRWFIIFCNSGRDLAREGGVGLVGLGNTSFILVISCNNQRNIVFFYVRGHYEL